MFSYTWNGRLQHRVRGECKYWNSLTCGTLNGFSGCSMSNRVRKFHFALSDLIYRTRLMNCWITSFPFRPICNYRYRSLIAPMRPRAQQNPHEKGECLWQPSDSALAVPFAHKRDQIKWIAWVSPIFLGDQTENFRTNHVSRWINQVCDIENLFRHHQQTDPAAYVNVSQRWTLCIDLIKNFPARVIKLNYSFPELFARTVMDWSVDQKDPGRVDEINILFIVE